MRSGSVGINLTSANHVFILEPALNPALEEQAVGRAWRMGQQREVTVKKFYVKVSICLPHLTSAFPCNSICFDHACEISQACSQQNSLKTALLPIFCLASTSQNKYTQDSAGIGVGGGAHHGDGAAAQAGPCGQRTQH